MRDSAWGNPKLTQLTTIRTGLVQSLGTERPSVDQVLDLILTQRSGLSKLHTTHRGALDVRGRDGSVDDLVGDLTTSMGELTDYEGSVSFGSGNDGLQVLDGVPGLSGG
jgi:hypothetical protein